MTTDNQSLPPLPAPHHGPRRWLGRAFEADAYTVEQMREYGDARAAHARRVALEEAANECERMMMYPGGRQESAVHSNVWQAAEAIRNMK